MGVSKLSAALRIAIGIGLVAYAFGVGLAQRAPWTLPFMGAGFTLAYAFGKLRAWRLARAQGGLKSFWALMPVTFLVQLGLVSVLYLIGFGLSALARGPAHPAAFAPGDAIWPIAVGVAASILGLYIDRLEGRPSGYVPQSAGSADAPERTAAPAAAADLRILPGRITPENLFAGIHFTHGSYATAPGSGFDGTPNNKSAGRTEEDIVRAEARLGRALPDGLIALYRVQNGGALTNVCIPHDGVTDLARYDQVILPFSGYNDLSPLENLRTVWDSVTDYADPADPDERGEFPEGAKAMVILAQWYRETLFLDYNQPGAPRVGFCDFDRFGTDGKREPVTWWPDFETFFASLRRFETI